MIEKMFSSCKKPHWSPSPSLSLSLSPSPSPPNRRRRGQSEKRALKPPENLPPKFYQELSLND